MSEALNYETAPKESPSQPGARLGLSVLLCINLFNYIDRQVLSAVEDSISKTFFGASVTAQTLAKMGLLSTAFIVSYMLAAPVLGWLADRMSRWLLVGASVLLWSGATAASGWATSFEMLLVTRMFVGIGEAGYGPAAPTLISDYFPVSRRGSVLAFFYVAIPVGSALGYVVGDRVNAFKGWHWAFYVAAVPGVFIGLWALFMKNPPRGSSDGADTSKPKMRDYLHLLRVRSFVLNTLAMAAMTFAIGGIGYWMPRYLHDVRQAPTFLGMPPKTLFGAITVVAGLSATLLGGYVGDKLRGRFGGSYFLVSGISMLIACPFVLLMLYQPFPMAWLSLFAACFFLFFNTGPSNTALANVVHPSVRASAFAFNIFAIHLLGDAPAPPMLGWVSGRYGWNTAFAIVAGMMALGGIIWLMATPFLKADTDAAPHRRESPALS